MKRKSAKKKKRGSGFCSWVFTLWVSSERKRRGRKPWESRGQQVKVEGREWGSSEGCSWWRRRLGGVRRYEPMSGGDYDSTAAWNSRLRGRRRRKRVAMTVMVSPGSSR
ncbi:hypothetical protein AMTRI_Chr13g121550 [Amborella trichopoda]